MLLDAVGIAPSVEAGATLVENQRSLRIDAGEPFMHDLGRPARGWLECRHQLSSFGARATVCSSSRLKCCTSTFWATSGDHEGARSNREEARRKILKDKLSELKHASGGAWGDVKPGATRA